MNLISCITPILTGNRRSTAYLHNALRGACPVLDFVGPPYSLIQEVAYPITVFPMGLQLRNLTERGFPPSFGPGKFDGHVHRKNKVLRWKDVCRAFFRPTVEFYDNDGVAVAIFYDETLGFGLPSALDLNPDHSVPLRIRGDQIVSGHIIVRFV